jgi:hypothetical protein
MAAASLIQIIRHAEKPFGSVSGIDPNGNADPESLIVPGWQRAGALGRLFAPLKGTPIRDGLAQPETIFASEIGHHSKSKRPQQTISVVAALLANSAATNFTFAKDDVTGMAQAAVATDGVVLICWEHQLIPAIANAIVGNDTTVPQQWPDNRFDVVWGFSRKHASDPWRFYQVPQLLLPGDSSAPIS